MSEGQGWIRANTILASLGVLLSAAVLVAVLTDREGSRPRGAPKLTRVRFFNASDKKATEVIVTPKDAATAVGLPATYAMVDSGNFRRTDLWTPFVATEPTAVRPGVIKVDVSVKMETMGAGATKTFTLEPQPILDGCTVEEVVVVVRNSPNAGKYLVSAFLGHQTDEYNKPLLANPALSQEIGP
jgi:hypothetical protein